MFNKILIANRGEIACRILKTCRRLGIAGVAVHSEADAGARHVRLADEAVAIGPPPARESYLVAARSIDAALRCGAQAIHPGYGFLSENAEFAEACAAAGLVFIGPPAAAMRAMGDKSAAKRLMEAAGVPLVPGYHGEDQDDALLLEQANRIGYPVLIKASAGGGGKGMRVVERAEDFAAALASCRRESLASFGDARVLIEKYLLRPRHIEIQVFADTHGNIVYLFERDCSVQRRHQKVLEEAPAPGLSPARRAAMGQAAVAAARAVGYVGAGTVEFIVADNGEFYFMEMNTRLQVEHPVTEMITGQDLVEWQLRVACGEPLPLSQDALEIRGHAIEARIYAEDAERGFLPATGTLAHLAPPRESLHVRVDTGVEEGDAISPYYDPMIAKLIVWDESRPAALARMQRALADYRVAGVVTNIDFLGRVVACPAFAQADLDTGLIERSRAFLFPASQPLPRGALFVAALAEMLGEADRARAAAQDSADPHSPWSARDGWRLNGGARRELRYRRGEETHCVAVAYAGDAYVLAVAEERVTARAQRRDDGALLVELDDRRLVATVIAVDDKRHVFLHGTSHVLTLEDPVKALVGAGQAGGGLTAPMPGRVIALLAEPGARVARGAPLLVLEAMKMEHTIAAPADGVLNAFRFAVGEQVGEGALLLDFAAEAVDQASE